MQLISLVGSAGSGKNAVADVLIEHHGFRSISFAGALKDAVACIFDWPRHLLEGDTAESRVWRETVQPWWADELDMPGLTPRIVLQKFGTEVIRHGFHERIWILTVKRKIHNLGPDARIVITDARFPNELDMTSAVGGKIVRVKRGENPAWWDAQLRINNDNPISRRLLEQQCGAQAADLQAFSDKLVLSQVHASERAWAREHFDWVVENDGTLNDLSLATEAMYGSFAWPN